MGFGDHELCVYACELLLFGGRGFEREERTAWPWLRGLMSRNASVLSDSKSLKQGISPALLETLVSFLALGRAFHRMELRGAPELGFEIELALDDLAKDAGCHFACHWVVGSLGEVLRQKEQQGT